MPRTPPRSRSVSRRRFLQVGAGTAAAMVLSPRLVAVASPAGLNQADRAVAAYSALQRSFTVGDGSLLYRESLPWAGNPYSYLWPFSHVGGGTLDLFELGAVSLDAVDTAMQGGLPAYWDAAGVPVGYESYVVPPLGAGGDRYYDDNAWVGLDLVRQYRLTGRAGALSQAEAVFAFIVSGWDTNPTHPYPGGVFWVESPANRDRNTVSNAPSAELGIQLFGITKTASYLDWAMRMYSWVDDTLRDPGDGLYWDHVALDGTIERTKWSYNQGTMTGANVLLFELTRVTDPVAAAAYLARGEAIATAALDYYARPDVGLAGQGPAFNAIFFRNLLALRSVSADAPLRTRILATMAGYADGLWVSNRGQDDLFRFPAVSPTVALLDQAAVVEIYASLARAEGDVPTPTTTTSTTTTSTTTTSTTGTPLPVEAPSSPALVTPKFTG